MRKVYADSVVEGAPLGNKNAAGKHGGGKGTVAHIGVGWVGKGKTGVSVHRVYGSQWKTRKYANPTAASMGRVQRIGAKLIKDGSFRKVSTGYEKKKIW